ncbi:MAG: redoxin domain-containing protein [Proteobacteria bacterium]|nr:redoxin domain-containing protein [Pseudomonadota bacterium]
MGRLITLIASLSLVLAACSSSPAGPLPDPPTPTTFEELNAAITTDGVPSAVNVWASWCLPCRSEAPLLAQATRSYPNVRFIALNVRDSERNAQEFMAEFYSTADMVHLSDRSGRIPIDMGATSGVPITFFYSSSGELVNMHLGIIDEPTLARFLDEIDR